MTEKMLRNILTEATEKKQIGIFIWANWRVWDDLAFEMKAGNRSYDFALSQITSEREATILTEIPGISGFSTPGFIAISIKKVNSSDKFFKEVLKVCEKGHYEGPVTLIPLNELSEQY